MIIKRDPDIIKCYFEDESGLRGGHAEELLEPEDEKDAIDILRDAAGKKTPLTISGGGTGVTGARVPFGGAILATDSLNKIPAKFKMCDRSDCYDYFLLTLKNILFSITTACYRDRREFI